MKTVINIIRSIISRGLLMSASLRALTAGLTLFGGSAAAQTETPSTDARIDALAAEVSRLKESLAVPETEALRSRYGLGPAASKVYGQDGLSIGGYGEFFFGHSLGDADERKPHSGDVYRFITYLGYKFDDRVVMNTELEFEHATTEANPENGETGAVSVEFMYLDFLLSPYANVRAGQVLMPVGFVNEMHEPTTYRGNFRPSIERQIIPSTWREAGVGLHGETPFGLSYDAYMVSGLSAKGFGSKGARGGRQHGNHFVWEDKAFLLRLDYAWDDTVLVGGSFYTGGADQDPTGDLEVTHTLYEVHAQVRARGAQVRGLFARNSTSGADEFAKATAEDPATATLPPEAQQGFYVEATYDVMPLLQPGTNQGLRPFARFEKYDLNAEVSSGATKSDALDLTELSAGVEFLPNPDVVVKGEYNQVTTAESGAEAVKTIRVGAGFIF
jgi:hypothetical protein